MFLDDVGGDLPTSPRVPTLTFGWSAELDRRARGCPVALAAEARTLRRVAGDPLGDWYAPKDEGPDEWAERQARARQRSEPDGCFDTALWIFVAVGAVVSAVWLVVGLILEVL